MKDLMETWRKTVALHEAQTDIKPVGCKIIKRETKRQAFLKKMPVRLGGGQKKKMKITKTETWECDAVEVPKHARSVPAPKVIDSKEHPTVPVKVEDKQGNVFPDFVDELLDQQKLKESLKRKIRIVIGNGKRNVKSNLCRNDRSSVLSRVNTRDHTKGAEAILKNRRKNGTKGTD